MYFAQDPTVPQVAEAMVAIIANNADQHWHLLCDSAFDHGRAEASYQGVNCYEVDRMRDLAAAGPWLMSLHVPGSDASSAASRLSHWLQHCSARPMLSVIASKEPAAPIAAHWSRLHMAVTQDQQKYLLRVADTRCLPLLAATLEPAQWAAWTQPLSQWWFIDRTGQLAEVPLAKQGTLPASAPLVLSDRQVDAIVQAAEPDALIAFFDEHMPDVVPPVVGLPASQWHRKVADTLANARSHGITRLQDKVALLQASLLTEGRSEQDARVLNLLETGSWQPGHLSDALLETGLFD